MSIDDTRAGTRPALFSLPEAAPAMVLRAGELLKGAGHLLAAVEIYETFIQGLQQHAMCPLEAAEVGTGKGDRETHEEILRHLLPVLSHPERYMNA